MVGQGLHVGLAEKAHGGERCVADSRAPPVGLLFENIGGAIWSRGQVTNKAALCDGADARPRDLWAGRAVQERRRGRLSQAMREIRKRGDQLAAQERGKGREVG